MCRLTVSFSPVKTSLYSLVYRFWSRVLLDGSVDGLVLTRQHLFIREYTTFSVDIFLTTQLTV